jgi:hypothetical protein
VLDEGLSPTANAIVFGTVNAMQQLAGGDHADCALPRAEGTLERQAPPLHVDQHRGVDQDGQAALGGPMVSRPASTSLAKSSSTAGALAISSRQRVAETTWWPLAGRICTIGTPLRTTSTSSPASTLLTTCEKFLATSVAVRRVMLEAYQINLI